MKQKLAAPMKTVCVGRFLLDIPASSAISLGSARIGGWEVSAPINESEAHFKGRLVARERELQNAKNSQLQSSLELTKEVNDKEVFGKVFMFDRVKNYYFENGARIEIEGVNFESLIQSKGRSFKLSADLRPEEKLTRKVKIAGQFERWSFDEIPEKPGFCIGEAFVNDPLTIEDREFVMMYIGIEEFPDLAIAISTWAGIDLEASLLERDSRNSVKETHASKFKDLGTGERTINGIRGGQVADEVTEHKGTYGFSFQWESALERNNVFRPRILLELDTGNGRPGNPVNSSLSREEVLELWNRISSSLRERPGRHAEVTESVFGQPWSPK